MPVHCARLLALALLMSASMAGAPVRSQSPESANLIPDGVPDRSALITRGVGYMYGDGVERDHVRALMWFILAENKGYYRLLAGHMSPLQISHAEALAEMCAGSNFTDCD